MTHISVQIQNTLNLKCYQVKVRRVRKKKPVRVDMLSKSIKR